MKNTMIKILTISVVGLVSANAQATPLQEWTFSDGSSLADTSNTGTPGDASFSTSDPDLTATVTDGVLRATDTTGIVISDVTFGTAFSSGQYELSWDWDTSIASEAELTSSGSLVAFGLRSSTVADDSTFVGLYWADGGDEFRLRVENNGSATYQQVLEVGSAVHALSMRVVADLDAATYEVFYNLNGAGEFSAGTYAMTVANIGGIRLYGDMDDIGVSNYIDTDNLRFSAVPEPATIGMLGLGGLITLLVRRMRTA